MDCIQAIQDIKKLLKVLEPVFKNFSGEDSIFCRNVILNWSCNREVNGRSSTHNFIIIIFILYKIDIVDIYQ